MKLNIVGDGSFGRFLKELLAPLFEMDAEADTAVLAVPISAYGDVASLYRNHHLVNVCSVQEPSMDAVLKYTSSVTGLHPLFGARTPADKRRAIVTRMISSRSDADQRYVDLEREFIERFARVSTIHLNDPDGRPFTPASHDVLMAKTHAAAVLAANQLKPYVEAAKDVPDEFIPNSFRLMREFVKTLEDTPAGTIESIMANPYVAQLDDQPGEN